MERIMNHDGANNCPWPVVGVFDHTELNWRDANVHIKCAKQMLGHRSKQKVKS